LDAKNAQVAMKTLKAYAPSPITSSTVGTIQTLLVMCGTSLLAVHADLVRGILEPEEAGTPSRVNAHGVTYPITRLARHLTLPQIMQPSEARVILCERQHWRRAVPVDQIIGLVEVQHDKVLPLPAQFTGVEREWFAGLFLYESRIVLLLNPMWLLTSEHEVSSLEDHREPDQPSSGASTPPLQTLYPQELTGHQVLDLTKKDNDEDAPWSHR
jgi:chemotaxis protein histidine kinase CheA